MPKLFTTVLTMALALGFASTAEADNRSFRAKLTGDQEVPTPVETDTVGRFKIRFNKSKTKAEYEVVVFDGNQVERAHLHCNFAGSNGPIVVFLTGDRRGDGIGVDGRWISNATIMDTNIVNDACGSNLADLAESMKDGQVYVNVHTNANPSGVIRGQIEKAKKFTFFKKRFFKDDDDSSSD